MNRWIGAAALTAGMVLATGANALSLNFADNANAFFAANTSAHTSGGNRKYEGTWDQLNAWNPALFTDGTVTLTDITATYAGGGSVVDADPFFDSDGKSAGSESGRAGLGVCHSGISPRSVSGTVSACSTNFGLNTDDDNVTASEALTLHFSTKVALTDILFGKVNHGKLTGSIGLEGATYAVTNGRLAAGVLDSLGARTTWNFFNTAGVHNEFYISSATATAVPLPAGLPLLLGAFGMVAGTRRLRKRNAG